MSEARIERLSRTIARCDDLYYNHGESPLPDSEYDRLVDELLSLGGVRPSRVGARDPGADVPHEVPMLSLGKVSGTSGLESWVQKVDQAADGGLSLSCEHKIDGLSVTLDYAAGALVGAATRGDGRVGRDVLAVVSRLPSVPSRLRGEVPPELTVRGEVYMPHETFEALCEAKRSAGEDAPANPRNAAAGALMRKDADTAAGQGLGLFVYDMVPVAGWPDSAVECLRRLAVLGLPVSPDATVVPDAAGVQEYFARVLSCRPGLGYDIDGIVVKADSMDVRNAMGVGSRTPYWAVACKFPAQEKITRLLGIEVEVGRTGRLTPVAELEPVPVDGSTVSRATLHNADQVSVKDVRVGDSVVVRKAGDVIPEVVSAVVSERPAGLVPWEFPTACPSCGGPVSVAFDAPDRYCADDACPGRSRALVEYFASRVAMDIRGLGPNQVGALMDAGLVSQPTDLYGLSAADVHRALVLRPPAQELASSATAGDVARCMQRAWSAALETAEPAAVAAMGAVAAALWEQVGGQSPLRRDGTVMRSGFSVLARTLRDCPDLVAEPLSAPAAAAAASAAAALLTALGDPSLSVSPSATAVAVHESIKTSKDRPAGRVLAGMGVRLCGSRVSGRLLDAFGTLPALASASVEEIAAVDGVGPAAAQNVHDWMSSGRGRQALAAVGRHQVGAPHGPATVRPPSSVTIAVTGAMSGPRSQAVARFEALGAEVAGSLSSRVEFLVTGDRPGASKVAKARSLDIPIISEEEFLARMADSAAGL